MRCATSSSVCSASLCSSAAAGILSTYSGETPTWLPGPLSTARA